MSPTLLHQIEATFEDYFPASLLFLMRAYCIRESCEQVVQRDIDIAPHFNHHKVAGFLKLLIFVPGVTDTHFAVQRKFLLPCHAGALNIR